MLRPASAAAYPGGFFFGPRLPVEQWYDVVAGDHVVECGAWTEEEEPVGLHPRDPHKRVETLRSSRHIEVIIDGTVVATSERPVVLLETDLPTLYYLPREDVRLDLLAAIADRVAFYNEMVDLRVDGVLLERPESPFSNIEQRPGGY